MCKVQVFSHVFFLKQSSMKTLFLLRVEVTAH